MKPVWTCDIPLGYSKDVLYPTDTAMPVKNNDSKHAIPKSNGCG